MTNMTSRQKKRKQRWFAPRQVYLRAGQESRYVELSSMLQVGVAVGFGIMALWLLGASYGVLNSFMKTDKSVSLLAKLETAEEELGTTKEMAAKIPALEAALAESRAAVAKAQQVDETAALSAELDRTKVQLEDLRQQLSVSKSEEATLEAKLEAQTIASGSPEDRPAEEASSLHAQLEEAFIEIEDLEKSRDEAEARLAALTAEKTANAGNTERNEALLNAATEEIERLQESLNGADQARNDQEAEHINAIDQLSAELNEAQTAKEALERRVESMSADLEQSDGDIEVATAEAFDVNVDAERHAAAIADDLEEAELLATVESLRSQIDEQPSDIEETSRSVTVNADQDDDSKDVATLEAELALAKEEIEKILKNSLVTAEKNEEALALAETSAAAVPRPAPAEDVKRLKSELQATTADNIKLKSDIRAAKKRLAEQADGTATATSKPDNTAKLERQLASTRTRIQQLNKALADAKLREVAIDLALISVVPSPSPPAPR